MKIDKFDKEFFQDKKNLILYQIVMTYIFTHQKNIYSLDKI